MIRARVLAGVGLVALVAAGLGAFFGIRAHIGAGVPASVQPPARAFAAAAYDPVNQTVVLFGGVGANHKPLGDTWVWDGTHWTEEHVASSPSPRSTATMAFDPLSRHIVLFGGAGNGTAPPDDTWLWNGSDWSKADGTPPGFTPGTGSASTLATDAASGQLLLVAPRLATVACAGHPVAPANDAVPCPAIAQPVVDESLAWKWTASGWQPLPSPPSGSNAGGGFGVLATDARTGHVEYFRGGLPIAGCGGTAGGEAPPAVCPQPLPAEPDTSGAPAGTVTAWTGSGWKDPLTLTVAPALALARPAADPIHLAVVAVASGATWTWDGSSWTRASTAPGPSRLAGAALAFDGAGDRLIEFGGSDTTGALSSATWSWEGTAWSLLVGAAPTPLPATPPPTLQPLPSAVCPYSPGTHPGQDLKPVCPLPMVPVQQP